MRKIDTIIIHCSATRPEWGENKPVAWMRDEIAKWHLAKGWTNIGYHYVIARDGEVISGRPIADAGAHTLGHNATSIGICLIGGHGSSADDEFTDNFTSKQDKALRELIDRTRAQFGDIRITGHNDYTTGKACPGFRVRKWLAETPERKSPPAWLAELIDWLRGVKR